MSVNEATPLLFASASAPTLTQRVLTWVRDTWRRVAALLVLGAAIWGVACALGGEDAFPPHGQLFQLALLSVLAYVAGWIVSFVHLPPLLGMLLTGVLLRNIKVVQFTGSYLLLEGTLRNLALVIILLRAGLGLDPEALKKMCLTILRLAVVPSLVEIISSALMSRLLFGMPWVWCFLLGSVLAAVSPAVVIPCLFSLQERGYGVGRGIPTLIVAAASLDDIIGISTFHIILSIIFSSDNLTNKILEGPLSIIYGLCFGVAWGFLLKYMPSSNDKYATTLRTLLLGAGCVFVMFGSNKIGYEGAGPLGCVVSAFVAVQGWRREGSAPNSNPVAANYAILWTVFQPILFGLIGTAVDLSVLQVHTVELGLGVLAVAITIRLLVSVLVAAGSDLNWKERLFIAIAWFPKATVQAAIGPVALDQAIALHQPEDKPYAMVILIIAVLAILATAPLGAVLITLMGPRLLKHQADSNNIHPPIEEQRRQLLVNDGEV
ncbi:sodium/hydrogen exchanger 9B2 [Anabrus simplex]|uniref:sodium/hydrogen exchanger 9B2 n=1 Tax=Anabrus simplex TaxID=316456 RepID=UPI0034DDA244